MVNANPAMIMPFPIAINLLYAFNRAKLAKVVLLVHLAFKDTLYKMKHAIKRESLFKNQRIFYCGHSINIQPK